MQSRMGSARMTRTMHRRITAIAVASALALGAAAWSAREPEPARPAAHASLIETLMLLRWGQGALDWTLPDAKGESHASIAHQRA